MVSLDANACDASNDFEFSSHGFSSQEWPPTARVSLKNKIFTLKVCVNVGLLSKTVSDDRMSFKTDVQAMQKISV
jgi:hypothetical protein